MNHTRQTNRPIRWRRTTVAVLILAILLTAVGGAALPGRVWSQGAVNVSIDALDVAQFPQVTAQVNVSDANGVPILGLGADRFEIVEDGRASFPPAAVAAHLTDDAIVSVVMVIDISGSMEGKPIQGAMSAANALLDQLSAQDRAAIIAFADEVASLDPIQLEEGKEYAFTTDKNAVRNVVNFLDTKIGWDTPLYDAIYKGVKMAAAEPAGRRALVVMTDGRDERDNAQGVPVKDAGSLSTPDDPINEANRHNIPIFAVGLGNKLDTRYLQRLAERTGGDYQQAPQPEELPPIFEEVVNQLKTRYLLDYASSVSKDSDLHSVTVRVTLPQGQDFDEIKFRPIAEAEAEPAAPEPAGSSAEGSEGAADAPAPASSGSGAVEPAPESEAGGMQGIVDEVRDIIEDQPALAIVVAAGILLLLILIIALIVVLARGRGAAEAAADDYTALDFETGPTFASGEEYSTPERGWSPTEPPAPAPAGEDRTEMAPTAWAEPFAAPPAAAAPPAPGAPGSEIPAAGGTRVIERGPKHLAMLVSRSDPGARYDLKGTINVGRSADNQIVLQDNTVSRHHAWIKAEGEDFTIFDVGSANGTFVNDERVEEPRQLGNGDVVRFGDAEFVFTKVF